MASSDWADSLSVLVLHNLDPSWLPPEREEAAKEADAVVAALRAEGCRVEPRCVDGPDLGAALAGVDPDRVVVLNWCEELPGVPHSEALVTAELEGRGFAFTGSPSSVLLKSWDKVATKKMLRRSGVPTPRWRAFAAAKIKGWTRYPAIVKPAREHCSLGVTPQAVVLDRDALLERVKYVLETFAQPAIVEEFIDGREFHVTVWGDRTLNVLPPAEMDFSALGEARDRLCSFDSKFQPGSHHWNSINVVLPAQLDEDEQRELAKVAMAAFRAVGCRDYARIDLRQHGATFTVLDVNPNCDLSTETSTALAAELALGSYGALLRRILGFAAARHPRLAEDPVARSRRGC